MIEVGTLAGYRGREFLVDTGAELSVAPRRIAEEDGQQWDTLPILDLVTIAPRRVQARLGLLRIRLGRTELSVRCSFLDQRNVPLVLGCADVLDRLALTIDAGLGKIVLTDLR